MDTKLIDTFQKARRDPNLAVIEGAQALKHALRFGATIHTIVSDREDLVTALLKDIAPDIAEHAAKLLKTVGEETFAKLSPILHRTHAVALANRARYEPKNANAKRPVILLENPRDLENIGAVIRVAAAADAAVFVLGELDVWHPAILRGSAALHFATPVVRLRSLDQLTGARVLIGMDPNGDAPSESVMTPNAIYVFGTERHGISEGLLAQCDHTVRLPMQPLVSSLNLATSVAATLYQPWLTSGK